MIFASIGADDPLNLAWNHSTWQTSTWLGDIGLPSQGNWMAVDGHTSAELWDASCSHTSDAREPNPTWSVDLGHAYLITHVKVTNRIECCGNSHRRYVGNKISLYLQANKVAFDYHRLARIKISTCWSNVRCLTFVKKSNR